ncbi:putative FAD-dependent thymidylate synthase [Campylobacter phage F367]|uniref:Putative FAD-dependent thymidylate synthetase n=3 Tax=Fletchervirus CPX TaxID=1110702 RepID=A0A7T3KGX9_9CAUD|nr:putative FAD-dependent thymidylate synthase [Campylobacter phage F365]QPX64770.1 putative FAD-dependent thymidylate synthase [Campylobacter phage F367]QPX64934.1 putative FAD-dependent thymidylate synthetase [Campylobacter phage F368]
MKNIEVKLLHHTPLEITIDAIRTCWDSGCKKDSVYEDGRLVLGNQDKALLDRIVNHHKHLSTIEHVYYNFFIKGISRACLQELARHRHASLSVESTRYTLKKHLKNEEEFRYEQDFDRASKYVVLTEDLESNLQILSNLDNLLRLVKQNKSNDVVKYALPEAFRTNLHWTINARSLRNFLELRSSSHALHEIRILANKVYESLPELHKRTLFKSIIKE